MSFARALFLTTLILTACASSPEKKAEEDATAARDATDQCLANPALGDSWGECNVKRTIFDRMAAIGACQRAHAKGVRAGDAIMLKIRIKPDGSVRDVKADESVRPTNKKLEACLGKEIAKLRFAKPPRGVKPVVYFPFQL